MFILRATIVVLLLPVCAMAVPKINLGLSDINWRERISGQWRLTVGGESFTEGKDASNVGGATASSNFNFKFSKWALFKSDLALHLRSRQVQSRFKSSNNAFDVDEAVVQLMPTAFAQIQFGAVNQGFLKSPLLVSNRAFPGLKEQLKFNFKNDISIAVVAEQVIPTSSSLDLQRKDKDPTAYFTTELLKFRYGPEENSSYYDFYVGHYQFSDLPSVVADESRSMGNTVVGEFVNSRQFKYNFNGWFSGAELCPFCDAKNGIYGGGKYLINSKASGSGDEGAEIYFGSYFSLNKSLTIGGLIGQFYNESDTVPAFYNSGEVGHNNRHGRKYNLQLLFRELGFSIIAKYVESHVINYTANGAQENLRSASLMVETINVKF